MITQKELKQLLQYNPATGRFTWLSRPLNTFKSDGEGRRWNSRYANTEAGHTGHKGYIAIKIHAKAYKAHRLAVLYINGSFPANDIDHINHTKTDNRWFNLRTCDHSANAKNRSMNKNNTTGVTGVYWDKSKNKWTAKIGVDGRLLGLGEYDDKLAAEHARKSAELRFGFHLNHGI